jgi:EpsI family protein
MKPLRSRLTIALILVAVGLGGQFLLGRRIAAARAESSSDLEQPLTQFPMKLGLWNGTDIPANPRIIEDIKIDQYLNREYVHPSGERVVLWMSFSKRSLDQYHYPTVCMEGNGWMEDESGRERIRLCGQVADQTDDEVFVPAMSMVFGKDDKKQLVYYWYYLIGEDSVDRMMRQSSRWARAFLRGRRNASLTVEVFSQSARPNRELLDDLARLVAEELQQWLPSGTDADCELGANY